MRTRLPLVLALVGVFAYEAYALFIKRSGETAYVPSTSDTYLSPEIAGDVTLEQTFVMHADGLEGICVYARGSATQTGFVHLLLTSDTYAEPIARQAVPASAVAARAPFCWAVPRVDQSVDRTFSIRVAMPEARSGGGVRLEVGTPAYAEGDLSIGGRSYWGDLKFRTRATRARLIDSMADLRRRAPPGLRSDAALAIGFLLFNTALVTIIVGVTTSKRR